MTIAYFDCYSGISGDMTLGALVDAGADPAALAREVAKLGLGGYELRFEPAAQHGITGTRAVVSLHEGHDHHHRHLSDILSIISSSPLSPRVKEQASGVFKLLGEAEAKVHGVGVEQVHFHEVGAVDAIVDVVGACVGLEMLRVERVFASALPTGKGMVRSSHGPIPVPAPATMEIASRVGAPLRPVDVDAELVTPTGAAILATVAAFSQPAFRLKAIGYGFGTRQLPWPNALRLWLGEPVEPARVEEKSLIEANLDDMTPEALGFAMDRLFAAGALDVFFTPIQMKKNRPAVMLSVIAPMEREGEFAGLVIKETTTLGVRISSTRRVVAGRRAETVDTALGAIVVKVKSFEGRETCSPEYEDCARIAREHGMPLSEVMRVAVDAWVGRQSP